MNEIGKLLVGLGLLLVVVGGLVIVTGRFGLPLGRLPGDLAYRGKHVSFFFPLGTSIVISIVLTLVLYLIAKLRG
jgi:hypothetical protein